jgi:hypothetical protein
MEYLYENGREKQNTLRKYYHGATFFTINSVETVLQLKFCTKTLITNKCTKESFIINCNTLLHVSTLLGHLQGELFRYLAVQARTAESSRFQKQRNTQSTAHFHSTVKCNPSVTVTKKFSLRMTQQGRNMYEYEMKKATNKCTVLTYSTFYSSFPRHVSA